jgi:NAD(P)-dependent dehydrogenase (short-subunit alcohol dehydrogenase family)
VAGKDNVGSVVANITSEEEVENVLKAASLRFGGLDLLVSNAGIASSAPLEDTRWMCGSAIRTFW